MKCIDCGSESMRILDSYVCSCCGKVKIVYFCPECYCSFDSDTLEYLESKDL